MLPVTKVSFLFFKVSLGFTLVMSLVGCYEQSTRPSLKSGDQIAEKAKEQENSMDDSAAQAEWQNLTAELAEKLRLLNRAPIELALFKKIKQQFPELAKTAVISFKNHPLLHGLETAENDNPSSLPAYESPSCESLKTTTLANEKDAINFSSTNLIKVNGPKFNCYPKNQTEVRRLVFHEYLGLMGISENSDGKTNYEITNALLKAFEALPDFDQARDIIEIRTCQELQDIGVTDLNDVADEKITSIKIFRLANDIDCTKSDSFNNGAGFRPLVVWGDVDGNGYTIKNLKITNKVPLDKMLIFEEQEAGRIDPESMKWINYDVNRAKALFYFNCKGCRITNLSLVNADIEGGALLVTHNFGTIQNVFVQGRLYGEVRQMGGLVSENHGSISWTSIDVNINQTPFPEAEMYNQFVGGLVSQSLYGSISDSTVVAKIKGIEYVAGLAALLTNSAVKNISMSVELKAEGYNILAGVIASHSSSTLQNLRGRVLLDGKQPSTRSRRLYLSAFVGEAEADYKSNDQRISKTDISHIDLEAKICGFDGETLDKKIKNSDEDDVNELRVAKDFGSLADVKINNIQVRTEFQKNCLSN